MVWPLAAAKYPLMSGTNRSFWVFGYQFATRDAESSHSDVP